MTIYINGIRATIEDILALEKDLKLGKNRAYAKVGKKSVNYITK